MPDAFISYSRQDADFVRRLAAGLQERGKDVWIDTNGIRDTEVFPDALRRAIEASDAFVFVISPDSVRSDFCEQEVAHAADLNKRIVPLALREVPDAELPDEIRVRNWIPVGEDAGVERVIAAIDTDLDWEREHTRLTVRALEWDQSGRDRSFLVRGSELRAAEPWLAAGAARPETSRPTALEQEYLLAARRAASRRQRTLVGVSAGVAVVAVALLVFALISRGQAVSAQAVAKSRALAAESQTELSADPELSTLLAIQAVRTSATPQAMYALREAIDQSPLRRQLPARGDQGCADFGFDEASPALAYSPSGGRIAEVACDRKVVILDDATRHVRARWDVGSSADAVAFSPDGRMLAVGAEGGITLLNAATGTVLRTLAPQSNKALCFGLLVCGTNPPNPPYCVPGPVGALGTIPAEVAFSPDGTRLAASSGFNLDVWQLDGSSVPRVVGGSNGCIEGIGFSRSGAQVLAANNADVDVIDAASGRLLGVRTVVRGAGSPGQLHPVVGRIAVSPNGRYVAVSIGLVERNGGEVELFNAAPWRHLATLASSASVPITALAFSPDSSRLAVGAGDGTARIWSVGSGQQLLPLGGHTTQITSIAWRPDGGELATASTDGRGLVWRASLSQGTTIATRAGLALAAANTRGDRVWGAFANPTPGFDLLRSWTRSGVPVGRPFAVPAPQTGYAAGISQNGRLAMLVDESPNLVIVALASSHTIGKVSLSFPLTGLSLAGDRLATGLSSGDVGFYEVGPAMSQIVAGSVLRGTCRGAYVAISDEGRRAAAVGSCGEGSVWNAQTGRQLETFATGAQAVSGVSLSPDGRLLAVSSRARTTTLFDLATKRALHVLTGDTAPVTAVAFSPRGTWLATSSDDGDVRIWDPDNGQLMRLLPEGANVTSVAFTPNGQDVVSTDSAGRIHIQDACSLCGNATALLRLAATRVTRQLTPAERQAYGT
jgi:WD40 repeat protein